MKFCPTILQQRVKIIIIISIFIDWHYYHFIYFKLEKNIENWLSFEYNLILIWNFDWYIYCFEYYFKEKLFCFYSNFYFYLFFCKNMRRLRTTVFCECTREDVHQESLRIWYTVICLHNELLRVAINHGARRSIRFSTLRNRQTATSLCWH